MILRRCGSLCAMWMAAALFGVAALVPQAKAKAEPNIILCMADDLGYGDVGYYGHEQLKTPHLDKMASEGIRFDRFYSADPVCSPTRASVLTGRHPNRQGVFSANVGHMREREITLAEAVHTKGYTTGHFGKWHLGTLTTQVHDSNRGGPGKTAHYSPPWSNGFDVAFSAEAKLPTWNPMLVPEDEGYGANAGAGGKKPGEPYGSYYWTGPEQRATKNLKGANARVIMDRAVDFIENASKREQPFLAVIWFHTPHKPTIGGGKYLKMYSGLPEDKRHYYAAVTAMDDQIGRLRQKLSDLGESDHTMLWFCSDNGPEGPSGDPGRTDGPSGESLRGRKRSLYEGGVRVPGLLVWPNQIDKPRVIDMPAVTSDYYPTILDYLNIDMVDQPELDGISLKPAIEGNMSQRPKPIAFQRGNREALTGNRYKLYHKKGQGYELYDLKKDPTEQNNIAEAHPEIVERMKKQLNKRRAAWRESRQGL